MVLIQGPLLLRSCAFSPLLSSYGDTHSPFWFISPSSPNNSGSQSPPLVFTLVILVFYPPLPLFHQAMPRQQEKPNNFSISYQNRMNMGNRHPPSFSLVLSSSPPSSNKSSPDQSSLPPLSSPWACCFEWFDFHGNSLKFSLGPLSTQGQTQGSMLQQRTNKTLTIGPFCDTCEVDEV
jgi:hypothetical protein